VVKIRLRRGGKKKEPIYKIVAADSRAARSGKFIEAFGTYNPNVEPMVVTVDETRLYKWLKRGAQPTDTVRSLMQRNGLWLKWSLVKKGADEAKIATELEKWQSLQAEKLRRESERKLRRKSARRKKAAAEAAPPAPGPEAPAPPAAPAADATPPS
jgi:small subunit ribosomal protein S16